MSTNGLLTRVQCRVEPAFDHVLLVLDDRTLLIPYGVAFEIAQGLRLASKLAMQRDREPSRSWRDLAGIDDQQAVSTSRSARRSDLQPNFKRWSIDFENTLVVMHFDGLTCRLHYSDALPLHNLIRSNAKIAKAWAGDTGKSRRMIGHLQDAEAIDKLNLPTN